MRLGRRPWSRIAAAVLAANVGLLGAAGCSGDGDGGGGGKDRVPVLGDPDFDPHQGKETGGTARYDLADGGWFALPFPCNTRLSAAGVDFSGFPEPRDGNQDPLLQTYLGMGGVLDGFSVQPTIYVAFDAPLDPKHLPTVKETLRQDTMFLIDLTPGSPHRGEQIPLRWRLSPGKAGQYLRPNLLMAQPTWGTPLRGRSTYAFVLRRGALDKEGRVLGRPPVLAAIIDRATGVRKQALPADHEALAAALAPLTDLLADPADRTVDVPPMDIAAATVFTTQDPVAELRRMAGFVRTSTERKAAYGWKVDKPDQSYRLVRGLYKAPNWQQGKVPYMSKGGGFVFDQGGKPVRQATEELRVAIAVPDDRSQEIDGKLPVVIYSHGTGGSYASFANGGKLEVAELLTQQGLAVIGIDQPLHGPRGGDPPLNKSVLELASFNYLNPVSARALFRQAALDNVYLLDMLRDGRLDIPASVAPGGTKVSLDPNRMLFMGHSQGALVGVLLASVEPHFRAFVFSGGGGGLSLTAVMRKDIVDFPQLIVTKLGLDEGELSEFHPAISLIQTLVDVTDPSAYGREVFARDPSIRPPHVLMTEGRLDEESVAPTGEALAASMGLAILHPAAHLNQAMIALGLPVLRKPVRNNLVFGTHKVTGVLVQYPKGNHFVVFKDPDAAKMYADFMFSVASTSEAIIQ